MGIEVIYSPNSDFKALSKLGERGRVRADFGNVQVGGRAWNEVFWKDGTALGGCAPEELKEGRGIPVADKA